MARRTAKITRPEESNEENIEIERVEDGDLQGEDDSETLLNLGNLRDLVFLGRLKEVVDIEGFKFVVTTLSTQQQVDIMHQVMKTDATDRILDIKPITVSYVIDSINGVPLEEICDDDSITNVEDRRLSVVYGLQSLVVERLYQVYEKLVEASGEEVGLDLLKE
jgi:hypothetical protein